MTFDNIPETLFFFGEKSFFTDYFIVFDDQSGHLRSCQRSEEEVVFPFWNFSAAVKCDSTEGNRRIIIIHRLLHPFFLLDSIAYFFAAVFQSISDGRPAIVGTGFDQVDFIASFGAEFSFPQIARHRMQSESLYIPMTIGVYLRPDSFYIFKRISRGRSTIFCDPQNFPESGIEDR